MNTIMSTTIVPDIHRHFARKSTISRSVKNLPLYSDTLNSSNHSKDSSSNLSDLSCNIKLEKEIPHEKQRFVLISDNDIEQMNIESNDQQIVSSVIEDIQNRIDEYFVEQIPNSNERPIISTNIHHILNNLVNCIEGNPNQSRSSIIHDVQMEETFMQNEQQSSILSQSRMDDDVVEIDVSRSCNCQCHQMISDASSINPTNEYILFEQALRKTRQEQQQERSLDNNHLIQTLKRQHQELLTLYHQQIHVNKIDREQQTIQISQHDSQIQTDLSSSSVQSRSISSQQSNGTHSTPNLKSLTTTNSRPFNNFLTPIRTTGPSLQQLIPCMTTTATTTTTTITNKTSTIKKPISTASVNSHSTSNSHDLVDLTEEDDDDDRTHTTSTQKIIPIKTQQHSPLIPPVVTDTARNQQINRSIRPNHIVSSSQPFTFRPLPEHIPCDNTIVRPQLNITHDNTTVRLTWNLPSTSMESIKNYEIYAYKQSAALAPSDWRKIGSVNSMRLPMAVTLKEFQSNSHYAFAVRAVSINNNIGPFCEPKTIFTGNTINSNSTVNSSTL